MPHTLNPPTHATMSRRGARARAAALWLVAGAPALLVVAGAAAADQASPPAPIRGILRSVNEATLSTDLATRVLALPVREGQAFKAGDVLADLDCAKYVAELKAAAAENKGHRIARDNSLSLQRMKAAGGLEVAVAEAQVEKSAAAVEAAQVRVNQCRVLAPFDGRVVDLLIHAFDMAAPNAPLMKIVDGEHLEIDLIAPSAWLRWLKPGLAFAFTVDETGGTVDARLERVGAAVDATSQTVKLTGVLTAKGTANVLPGMSGTATFDVPGG